MNENLTEALADVRTALESAATAAVESTAENFDFDPAIESACDNYNFERAIESALDNFDFSDSVEQAAKEYDFTEQAEQALEDAFQSGSIEEKIEEAARDFNFGPAYEMWLEQSGIGDEVARLTAGVEALSAKIAELEAARLSARVAKAYSFAKAKVIAARNWVRGKFGK